MKHETVLVLDFGGQYNELIARRVRDLGVYCEVHPYNKALEKIKELCPIGIIFTGGPNSVYEEGAPKVDPAVFQQGLPILGLCYGLQMMSQVLGGEVKSAPTREFGKTPVHYDTESLLFKGMPQEAICWMSHVDYVSRLPEGFTAICHTAATANAGIQCKEKNLYGVQFHPEVEHTQFGNDILKNFLYEICHAKGDWSMKDYARSTVEALREKIGDGVVGRTTWNSLYGRASQLRSSGPVVTLKRLPYPGTPLTVGSSGKVVLYYNLLLQRIAYYFSSVEAPPLADRYTEETATATRSAALFIPCLIPRRSPS